MLHGGPLVIFHCTVLCLSKQMQLCKRHWFLKAFLFYNLFWFMPQCPKVYFSSQFKLKTKSIYIPYSLYLILTFLLLVRTVLGSQGQYKYMKNAANNI